jgi:iron(II)-dependent oxidoreductase
MDLHTGEPLARSRIAELLTEARARTLLLTSVLTEDELRQQHDRIMSPIVWDLGHIAHFEEVWLLENIESGSAGSEGLRGIYNPFEHPRATRDALPLPSLQECRAYMGTVRRAVLDRLACLDLAAGTELLHDGFVFRMVLQHEYQHNETILQTLQLKAGRAFPAPRGIAVPEPARGAPAAGSMVRFPGGDVEHGTHDRTAAYDNERPRHRVSLAPFWIDAHPVTNGEFLGFVDGGGYRERKHWSDAGWAWLQETGARAPGHWSETGQGWTVRTMDVEGPIDHRRPVCHIGYWEGEAWARWAGKRLPTEFEWEAAASWEPDSATKRSYPWGEEPPDAGRCNVDQLAFGTAPVGAYPRGVSPIGCWGMIGDVWEWTSTDFHGYPGYRTFPYPEYSEVFFGDEYKVLRGGSWATRPGAIRATFRNWDYPIRRQIFAGFRCARDD